MMPAYESNFVTSKHSAQDYYEGRELTERKIYFNGGTTYTTEYPRHPLQPINRAQTAPDLPFNSGRSDGKSLYQADFPGWAVPKKKFHRPREDVPPSMPFYSTTSYAANFTAKPISVTANKQKAERPWPQRPFIADTEYRNRFVGERGRPATKVPQPQPDIMQIPFSSNTTYGRDFLPRPTPKYVRHGNTGDKPIPHRKFLATTTHGETFQGIQLSKRQQHLGVQVLGGKFHVLIPSHKTWPCTGTHIFSTARNNQKELCILVQQGNSNHGSDNKLLGQFDLVNIPPAPRQLPAIEVTFRVDVRGKLTAEAKDLDYDRHKQWTAARGAIVIK